MGDAKPAGLKTIFLSLKKKQFLYAFLMGFSSGLPFLLTSNTLQAWMKDAQLDLTVIGIFSMIGLPYTLKFVWAPLLDRYQLPFFGRRRGWIFLAQSGLAFFTMAISFVQPGTHLKLFAIIALIIAFLSASQDIVVDAYRRETLSDEELGFGSALYQYGYRIAMMLAGAFALILADHISWSLVYLLMASIILMTIFITFTAPEPQQYQPPPKSLTESVIGPFVDYLKRDGAIIILLFILLFKVGDNLAGRMLTPFYLDMGFSKTEIGSIAKIFAPAFAWLGPVIGGFFVFKFGIYRALWFSGFLQAASTFGFVLLSWVGKNNWMLAAVVGFEDLTATIGTIAFVAYMASLCDKRFTATQYALLSSLSGVPRVIIATPSGYLAKLMGWSNYFLLCTAIAIPGMLLLLYIRKRYRV